MDLFVDLSSVLWDNTTFQLPFLRKITMYILKYNENNDPFREVEERMRSLSLGFKIEQQKEMDTVSLYDDEELIASGKTAILAHLDEVSGELHQWYYCSC